MPALVNINVGSLRGTSGDDGTTSWPSRAKKSRKVDLISLTPVMVGNSLTTPRFPVQKSGPFEPELICRRKAYKPSCNTSQTRPPMNENAAPLPGTLSEKLSQGRFVMTADLAPPVSCDAQ